MRHHNPLSRITLRLCGAVLTASVVLLASCGSPQEPKPTEDAAAFIKRAEPEWQSRWIAAERAEWVRATYINFDTSLIASQAEEGKMEAETRLGREAARFKDVSSPEDVTRSA